MSPRRPPAGGGGEEQLAFELPGGTPAGDEGRPAVDADAVADLLRRHRPTAEQRGVVEAGLEPLLVVAGAGSGKTETMAARVVQLVVTGQVAPDRVLGLTFTRKAAGELAERVRVRLRALRAALDEGRGPAGLVVPEGEPVVATYHSYAAGVLAEHGLRVGVEPGARVLGEAAAWQLAAEVVEGWTEGLPGVDSAVSTVVAAVVALGGECAEHLVGPDELEASLGAVLDRVGRLPKDDAGGEPPRPLPASTAKLLAPLRSRRALVPLLRAYAARKAAAEVLDFGDQVRLAALAATRAPAVGATERDRYDVVLLDEYQDTSHAQLELLRALFGGGHPVTAVGDPHQSIYGFRGASAGTLARFPGQFPRADGTPARVLHLSTSWRNDEQVLVAANAVSAPLREGPAGGGDLVPPLGPSPRAGRGELRVSWYGTSAEEAAALAGAVAAAWTAPGERPTAAVLCRRRAQVPLVEEALRAAGLPVEVVGMGGLLERPEVLDVLAVLHAVHDPGRGDVLARLLTGPRWHLGPRDLRALGREARRLGREAVGGPAAGAAGATGDGAAPEADDVVAEAVAAGDVAAAERPEPAESAGLVEVLEALAGDRPDGRPHRGLSAAAHARLVRLGRELAALRARSSQPLPDLVADVVRTTHLEVELAAAPGASPSGAAAQLDALVEVAAGFAGAAGAPDGRTPLGGFLAWVEAAAVRERGLDQADEEEPRGEPEEVEASRTAVQVLTVHAAKGLEWDVVAVPGMGEGAFPGGAGRSATDTASGWLTGLDALPYPLRGDAASLPVWHEPSAGSLAGLTAATARFKEECGASVVGEERRLGYVAVTRARHLLLLSGATWTPGRSTPVRPSRFLLEVADAAGEREAVEVAVAAAGEAAEPPEPATAPWPDPSGPPAPLREAAAAVREARAALAAAGPADAAAGGEWAEDVELLLAERAAARRTTAEVELPPHLSASRVVQLARDPASLALAVRRPVPQPPARAARRGTAFHAWLERRWGAAALVELEDLPGAQDAGAAPDEELPRLQAAFEASEWASRVPERVEVPVETPVDGTVLRGRVDAVFRTPDGGWEVVDWKTGRVPTADDAAAAAAQLAVYRLAWARLQDVPLERVSAAFFYAASGRTVRPLAGLDETALLAVLRAAPVVDG